jgi:hypothetical protein
MRSQYDYLSNPPFPSTDDVTQKNAEVQEAWPRISGKLQCSTLLAFILSETTFI